MCRGGLTRDGRHFSSAGRYEDNGIVIGDVEIRGGKGANRLRQWELGRRGIPTDLRMGLD